MFVVGIQGSPRKKGNTDLLLSSFLEECERRGAQTRTILPHEMDVRACRELIEKEKKGFCPIRDEMESEGYALMRQADAVVLASPVFFYAVTAQIKVFIDRCQMFWGRKYKLKLKDPDRFVRRGFFLSVAASGGKRLFDGVELTAKYFFDAISAEFAGGLTYKKVEAAGDIVDRPGLEQEIRDAVDRLLGPVQEKPVLVFISPGGRCRSPIAAAFTKEKAQGGLRVIAAGQTDEAVPVDPSAVKAMEACSLDIKHTSALPLAGIPGMGAGRIRAVFIGPDGENPLPGTAEVWEIPEPDPADPGAMAALRDRIRDKVRGLSVN